MKSHSDWLSISCMRSNLPITLICVKHCPSIILRTYFVCLQQHSRQLHLPHLSLVPFVICLLFTYVQLASNFEEQEPKKASKNFATDIKINRNNGRVCTVSS